MREFIGRVPKRSDLLEIFKRYITIISPRDNLETCFLDLAASINSRTIDVGQECDVKDTYSYILALLAGVRYFVSEDSDLERLYEYLTRVRGMDSQAKAREIRRIRDVYRLLCDIPESTFPVEDVLRFLFLGSDPLTVPISISRIQAQLPDVLDKAHMMLSILRTLREADLMRKSVGDKTEGLDVALLEKARSRVREVAKDIGVDHTASTELIAARLVEEEAKWKEHPSDRELALQLSNQLDLFWSYLYEQDDEDHYNSLEEKFNAEDPTKKFLVECEECDRRFELEADYQGVVETEQRSMGAEHCHEWLAHDVCPGCRNNVELHHNVWEYPLFWFNYEDTYCIGCEIVHGETDSQKTESLEHFF